MEKVSLNNYTMNEALAILKQATLTSEHQHFEVACDNCVISITTGGLCSVGNEAVEIALFTTEGYWYSIEMSDGYTLDKAIIPKLPLICFPAFIKQFKSLTDENIAEVWDAWDTIACYM